MFRSKPYSRSVTGLTEFRWTQVMAARHRASQRSVELVELVTGAKSDALPYSKACWAGPTRRALPAPLLDAWRGVGTTSTRGWISIRSRQTPRWEGR